MHLNPKYPPLLFILGSAVLLFKEPEAACPFNLSPLQDAFATFCPGISSRPMGTSSEGTNPCCRSSFYLNENGVTLDHVTRFHRQCSRDFHPDKNPDLEAEDRMKQCNGGREILETHFSCLAGDKTYRAWMATHWPLEAYLKECRKAWGKPLTEADLQQKKDNIQAVFQRARAGDYGL